MCAHAITSALGSAAGSGASPGSASISDRIGEERRRRRAAPRTSRRTRRRRGAARARAPDSTSRRPRTRSCRRCRARPRSRRAGRAARAIPRSIRPTSSLDRLLAVRGAHHRRAGSREILELPRADPRGTRAEPPVGGLELVGDLQDCLGHRAYSKSARSACPGARRHGRRFTVVNPTQHAPVTAAQRL